MSFFKIFYENFRSGKFCLNRFQCNFHVISLNPFYDINMFHQHTYITYNLFYTKKEFER